KKNPIIGVVVIHAIDAVFRIGMTIKFIAYDTIVSRGREDKYFDVWTIILGAVVGGLVDLVIDGVVFWFAYAARKPMQQYALLVQRIRLREEKQRARKAALQLAPPIDPGTGSQGGAGTGPDLADAASPAQTPGATGSQTPRV
ncbi:hypothetical protein PFISCL1PPCAC_22721, partial [Pristionchus fissidentatus]